MKEKPKLNPDLIIASRLQREVNVIIDVIILYIQQTTIASAINLVDDVLFTAIDVPSDYCSFKSFKYLSVYLFIPSHTCF